MALYNWDRYTALQYYYWDKYYANSYYSSGSFSYVHTTNGTSYGGATGYSFNSSSGQYSTSGYPFTTYSTSQTSPLYSAGGSSISRYRGNGQGTGYHYDTASSSFAGYTRGSYITTTTGGYSSYTSGTRNSDGYWYERGSSFYQKGSYVDSIVADETAYTNNARNADGYWYVKTTPAKTQVGTAKIAKGDGSFLAIPIFDIAVGMTGKDQLRVQLGDMIACFELVDVTDANASPLRVKTATGIKAISKA